MLIFIQFHIPDMRISFTQNNSKQDCEIVKLLNMKHFPNWNDETKIKVKKSNKFSDVCAILTVDMSSKMLNPFINVLNMQ